MHGLLVLTVEESKWTPDPELKLVRPDGTVQSFVFVATIDRLAHYRNAELPEETARELLA